MFQRVHIDEHHTEVPHEHSAAEMKSAAGKDQFPKSILPVCTVHEYQCWHGLSTPELRLKRVIDSVTAAIMHSQCAVLVCT